MINTLTKISKVSIYLLVFLLPIFFLPWTNNILDFNKQALLVFLVFVSLFCWLLKSLKEGRITLDWSRFNLTVIIFLLVLIISTLFSSWRYGSFWGWPLNIASAFLTILGFALLYFLIVNIFQKTEIFGILFTLILSGFLAVLFGGFQLFGKFFLLFDFTRTSSFNTVGTANSLGMFASFLFPLVISLIFISKKIIKVLLMLVGLVMLSLIFLVNFWAAWISLFIGMAAILIFGISRRQTFSAGWLTMSMALLIVTVFFGIFRVSIPGLPTIPLEVSPSQAATFSITRQTLAESPSNLLLGSGPSTFVYDYSKFKLEAINQTSFWETRFSTGASEILDKLATTGILGLVSFLGVLAFFFGLGIKGIIRKFGDKESLWVLNLGIFASWLTAATGLFLYPANVSLKFLFWVFTAVFIVFCGQKIKSWELKPFSLINTGVSFVFILIFVLGIGIFFFAGQRYIAEIRYFQGIEAQRRGDNRASIDYLLSAISHSGGSQDNYWRDLSQIYLLKVKEEIQKEGTVSVGISQSISSLVSNAVNSAKRATDLVPENVANWVVRGFVYWNSINLVGGEAEEWAVSSFQKAIELEPTNPVLYIELGNVYLVQNNFDGAREYFQKSIDLKPDYIPAHLRMALVFAAEGNTAEAIEKLEEIKQLAPLYIDLAYQLGVLYYDSGQLSRAQAEFERAVNLDPNYSNARYFLGLIYDRQGKKDLAILQFERIAVLNPNNAEVKKILKNLREDKAALEGIVELETLPTEESETIPTEE